MSSGSRRAGAPGGPATRRQNVAPRKGSVTAAREAVERGQHIEPPMPAMRAPPRFPFNGGQPSPQQSPRNDQFPPSINIPPPSPGPAPSAPLPSPGAQWPLRSDTGDSPARKEPPQRPPRPDYVPSMLDPSRQKADGSSSGLAPASQQEQWDEDFLSPTAASSSRPLTTSSQGSVSSLGSIPDFPVPVPIVQQTPRRSPNIGPPPSARRGPSSYYQTLSYVSPIAEESEYSRSHGSYASSNVMPRGQSAFYLEEGEGSLTDEDEGPATSRGSSYAEDHTDQSQLVQLVRQASLGKRGKPSLTTIKGKDDVKSEEKRQRKAAKAATGSHDPSNAPTPNSFSSGTALVDGSTSSNGSSESILTRMSIANRLQPEGGSKPPSPQLQQPRDSDVSHVLEGLQKGGAISMDTAALMKPRNDGLAARVGQRRPPRLDVDAVREAEARGSLTSLPDLIHRATRLAANLERGKTASRLGMEWFTQDSINQGRRQHGGRRSGSLSDMLNHFPSPGAHTPTGEKPDALNNRASYWPAPHGYSPSPLRQNNASEEKSGQPGRRCCGMRFWVFIALIVILLILIAAAIVIPIALIVLPNNNSGNAGSTSNAIVSCQQSNPCRNGGQSVLDAKGNCSCVCVDGFTGSTCTEKRDHACSTMNVDGMSNKATVGSAVVPLLNQAENAFGVPLNSSVILAQFSTAGVSCALENSLVTFNGRAITARSLLPRPRPIPATRVGSSPESRRTPAPPRPRNTKKAPAGPFREYRVVTSTAHGLLVAATASAESHGTPSSSSTQPSGSPSGAMSHGTAAQQRENFARVAVLFILQNTASLAQATDAQTALQNHFNSVRSGNADAGAASVDAGGGFTVDFDTLAISLPGGGSVGGWG